MKTRASIQTLARWLAGSRPAMTRNENRDIGSPFMGSLVLGQFWLICDMHGLSQRVRNTLRSGNLRRRRSIIVY
jgi:hypothetical protein